MIAHDNPLFDAFLSIAEQQPNALALRTDAGQDWLYGDLLQLSAQQATVLTEAGLRPGDRLSVQTEKSPQALCLYLACLRSGIVYHPLNPDYTSAELDYLLRDARPSALVISGERARQAPVGSTPSTVWTLERDGSGTLSEACAKISQPFPACTRALSDTAALLYSSGTTGRPKGIPLSHQNLLSNAQVLIELWQFTAADVLLHALPIFHVHGLFVACHCALLSGASMLWHARFDPALVRQALPKATVMMGVPTHYTRLLADPAFNQSDCRQLRLFISGSAPLLKETSAAFAARIGQVILERYGMTETGMLTSNPLHEERRAGTVGFPLPGVSLRIVDSQGDAVESGAIGDIQVKGANVFAGYWGRESQRLDDFTGDDFFRTGDQGLLDGDGYLHIVGRSKDMIITGGLNVYPTEIEKILNQQEGVRESAVIGLPHPDFGEAVAAVLDWEGAEPPAEAQLRLALQRELAGYKIPKAVFFVAALPRNAMGKVQKAQLRQQYAQHFAGNGTGAGESPQSADDSTDQAALQ